MPARFIPRIPRDCIQCGKRFMALRIEVLRGGAKLCSRQCTYLWMGGNRRVRSTTKYSTENCKRCGKGITVTLYQLKRGRGNFCSKGCVSRTYGGKGSNPLEYCQRGHLMAETRRMASNGFSYCGTCKSARSIGIDLPSNVKGKLLGLQNGKCAICGSDNWGKKGPALDHDHRTGLIRGVLCGRCNTAIGLLDDNIEALRAAISYLESGGTHASRK